MEGDLFSALVLKRQREIEAGKPDGPHVRWLPRLVAALGQVVESGRRMAQPHSDHHEAQNYRNALLNLAAVALAAMPHVKTLPCEGCRT